MLLWRMFCCSLFWEQHLPRFVLLHKKYPLRLPRHFTAVNRQVLTHQPLLPSLSSVWFLSSVFLLLLHILSRRSSTHTHTETHTHTLRLPWVRTEFGDVAASRLCLREGQLACPCPLGQLRARSSLRHGAV